MEITEIKKLEDEVIVREFILTKNPALFDIIYERYEQKIFFKCLNFSNDTNEASDLAHDVFLKIFLNLSAFKFKSKFSTWVFSITYNLCIDYVKRNRLEFVEIEPDSEYDVEEYDDHHLLQIKVDNLTRLLNKLKPEEKAVILMKYLDGLNIKEISAIMNIGESAVKMRIKRTKNKLVQMNNEQEKLLNNN